MTLDERFEAIAKGHQELQARIVELSEVLGKRHDEIEHHLVQMMERQADSEARQAKTELLTHQVTENNIRLSRIIEVHDYSIDEMDARLRRLEQRHPPRQ